MNRDIPFGYTLLTASTVCFGFWSVVLSPIQYAVTLSFMGFQFCCACWLVIGVEKLVRRIRRAFTYASHDLADFVRGKGKSKPVENPLLRDPFYASIDAQITEAKTRHKRVKHLYAKREHRVNELLGKKGAA